MPLKKKSSKNLLTSISFTPKSIVPASSSVAGRINLHNNNVHMNSPNRQTLQLLQKNSVFSLISPSNKLRDGSVCSEFSGFSQQSVIKKMVIQEDSSYDKVQK